MIIYNKQIKEEDLLKFNIVISENSKVANGVKLGCNVCIVGDSIVEKDVEIGSNSVLENCIIKQGAKIVSSFLTDSKVGNFSTIGPFANLRTNSVVGKNCRIGNFVEIKNSKIGDGCKIAHLTYVGDAELKENCNIGCGVVFCNYNGEIKQKTLIGKNVFIGSNVNLIAPLKIEDCVYIAAGSTINKDIKKFNFAIARARQVNKQEFLNPYIKTLKNSKK